MLRGCNEKEFPFKKWNPPKRRLLRHSCFFLFALVLLTHLLPSPVRPLTLKEASVHNPPVNRDVLRGIDLLYNNRFNEAEEIFSKVIAKHPYTPMGYFYLAMVSWSRLASGFWTPEIVENYNKRIDRTIYVAKTRIENESAGSFDYFYLGGALGFKGRFELMRSKWVSSFLLAAEAVDALKTCLKLNPENRDVLLGLGTFDYYTARLSGALRFMSYLLIHRGDRQEGLRKLHVAAREAIYSGAEAKSMLLHIYLFLEEDFYRALELAKDLGERYEENYRFMFLKGVSQIRLGKVIPYRQTVSRMRKKALESSSKKTGALWDRRALYLEAIYDLYQGRYPKARSKMLKILSRTDPQNDPSMIGWPLVKMGMSYDLEGNREKAKRYYTRVTRMKNGSGAQFLAKKLLDEPPKRNDPFIGY